MNRRDCLRWSLALAGACLVGRPATGEEAADLRKLGERLERILHGGPLPPGLVLEDHKMRGLEQCAVCGEAVNMGWFRLHGGQETVVLPYLAAHTLKEHGRPDYEGSLHQGRVDVAALERVLSAVP